MWKMITDNSLVSAIVAGLTVSIGNQVEHHCRVTFKEEFVDFLIKHEIEYDERYIWN